jgi:uncharacterized protein YndB with AHSA1/START domain
MQEIAREAYVDGPPEGVWDWIASVDRMAEWLTFADRVELISGTGVGRRQRLHGQWGGKRSEIDQEVTEYDPPRVLAWRHLAERLDGRPAPRFARSTEFRIVLAGAGDGTQVRLESRQEPVNWIGGVAMRLFGAREVSGHMKRSLQRLSILAGRPR